MSNKAMCKSTSNRVTELPSKPVFNDGASLFYADRNTEIVTEQGTVKLLKGALALIVSSKDCLSVYNLDDNKNSG